MASTKQKKTSKIPYNCGFCRVQLTTTEFGWTDYLRCLLLLRPFQCPHCFNCVIRPFSLIGRLPLIGLLFRGRSHGSSSRSGVLPHREGDVNSGWVRGISNFGRLVQKCEKAIGSFFAAIFRAIWAVVWFVPGLIFGKKRRRSRSRSRKRFLKSQF